MSGCIQYIRVSSEEQAKGGSLGAQKREGAEYAEKKGLTISEIFKDTETAKSEGRDQFGRMVNFLNKAKKPVILLVEKTDRLYRNYDDMVLDQKLVKKKGHEVHLYKEGEVLNSETKSHTWLVHYFKVAMATNYVENLSEEIRKGRKQKLLNGGWPHRAPYGYRNNPKTKNIEIEETEADFVKEAFNLCASGLYSMRRIAKILYDNGYIYKPGFPEITKGGLDKMLKNPFYIGKMEVKGQIYPGNHPPLINLEVWQQTQAAIKLTAKPLSYGTIDFKYGHLLKCFSCGGAMVGENKKQGRYVYYRCARQKQGCSQGYVNEAKLDKEFEAMVQSLVIPPSYKEAIIQAAEEIGPELAEKTKTELRKIETQREKERNLYKKMLLQKLQGGVNEEVWEEIHRDFEANMQKLDQRKRLVEANDVNYLRLAQRWVELPEMLSTRWNRASNAQKLELINLLGSNFFVEGEKLHYELKEPFSQFEKKALRQAWWSIGDSNS